MISSGHHQFWSERDIICARWRADIRPEDMAVFFPLIEATYARYGYYFVLCDISGMGAMTKETRRCISDWAREHQASAAATTICYGGSLALKAVISLVTRAVALVKGESPQLVFVKSEADGRALIERLRRENAARV